MKIDWRVKRDEKVEQTREDFYYLFSTQVTHEFIQSDFIKLMMLPPLHDYIILQKLHEHFDGSDFLGLLLSHITFQHFVNILRSKDI